MKNKEWFIAEYEDIHSNLVYLDDEIQSYLKDKTDLINDDEILENLRTRVSDEIIRLKKTREYEREIFNY